MKRNEKIANYKEGELILLPTQTIQQSILPASGSFRFVIKHIGCESVDKVGYTPTVVPVCKSPITQPTLMQLVAAVASWNFELLLLGSGS